MTEAMQLSSLQVFAEETSRKRRGARAGTRKRKGRETITICFIKANGHSNARITSEVNPLREQNCE